MAKIAMIAKWVLSLTFSIFQAGEKFPRARLERRSVQYLYQDGEQLVFMDAQTYDQLPFSREQVGDARLYLQENLDVLARVQEEAGCKILLALKGFAAWSVFDQVKQVLPGAAASALWEAKLAREAEISYATLAAITDYDCWHEAHETVTVEMIIANLNKNAENAKQVLRNAIAIELRKRKARTA